MKKLLFTALVVFGLASINAQEVKFGAKAGLNLASVSGDDTDDLDSRTSFHLGVVAEIAISDKFSLQPELLYSAQGAKESFEGIDIDLKLDYINLPIMAKFYVADGFSLELGPQVGFLMSAKAEGEGESEDIKDFVKGIDFGANFGVGYKMESGLNFGARYNLGFSNINDGEGSDEFKNQNSVIQISVGYFF
ncbi:MAG: porin family protein [Tamlana sp.]